MTAISLVCASNSDAILAANLVASPGLARGVTLHVERNAPTAAIAYNRGLDATDGEIVVFAHHDVYLPRGWVDLLTHRLADLTRRHPDWALTGAFGVAADRRQFGPVWTSSLGQIVGRVPMQPEPVHSFDELLIVLRRSSGLRFDDLQPGWHMYGTDIVCRARQAGLGAYAVGLPCIHNDRFHEALGPDFTESYRWMQARWPQYLPLQTPVTRLNRHWLNLLRDRWNMRRSIQWRAVDAVDTGLPAADLAARCGWADLTPSIG
jgi:glycosyltransferase involved in cell wall biosynthesis